MQFTALNTLAFVDIPKALMSSATSFAAVVQQMGMDTQRLAAWQEAQQLAMGMIR